MAEIVRFLRPVKLTGSTHKERIDALAGALRKVPVEDNATRRALFDAYLICDAASGGDVG